MFTSLSMVPVGLEFAYKIRYNYTFINVCASTHECFMSYGDQNGPRRT